VLLGRKAEAEAALEEAITRLEGNVPVQEWAIIRAYEHYGRALDMA
jgi:hypothetical protein